MPLEPGLKSSAFSSIPFTAQGIRIDGQLDDWKGIAGYDYNPLAAAPKSVKDPSIAALVADPISVNFRTCYDAQGIYFVVVWHDRNPGRHKGSAAEVAHWPDGGEGFELHLRTDQVIHLACWPSAGGAVIMGRRDDDTEWQDLSKTIMAAGAAGADKKSYAMELALPWSMVTASGKIPADGKAQLGCDFAWNALPSALVPAVRAAVMDAQGSVPGVDYNFLTSRAGLVAADPLVMNADVTWGDVGVGDRMSGDAAKKAADGSTSISSFSLPTAAAAPKLDGTLAGWDPAWLQTANYLGALYGNRFRCQIAGQYDQDNLYLAAVFPGSAPANLAPAASGKPFSGGDVLRLQLSDGDKRFAIDGWFDGSTGQPALLLEGSGAQPGVSLMTQGAKEVFKADGKGGYLQEIAVPWKALLGAAPKLTDQVKGTFRVGLADASNRFSVLADATLEQHPALSVAYKMPADGELTLGLFSQDGQLLRWLTQGDYRYAGDNREPWDGLDQYGNPVPAGSYVLKGAYHPPLTTDYKTSVCNPGTPPWPTPDGKGDWLGDEHDPQATVSDGKWVYLAAPGSELGYAIIAVDENGQRQWGIRAGATGDRSVSLALSGNYIYALYSGGQLVEGTKTRNYDGTNGIGKAWLACYDKRTGKPAGFTIKEPNLVLTTWPYRNDYTWLDVLRNNKSFTPQVYGGQPRYYCTDVGETTNALGLAAIGDVLYVSLNYDNKIIAVDATTGVPNGLEIPVDSPVGLCPIDDHTLLAVSGKQVVKVDVTSKAVTPLITSNLVAPDNITTDKDGNIYVSDWATSFQVKVFNSSGTFLHAIGKEGGRPWVGKWDADGMLVPRGVAVTDAGKVWVAEDDGSPKRISVWDSKSGALLKDYVGPAPYGGGTLFWIDPKDPTLVHCEGTCFKVDYAKKTYTPLAIDYRRQNHDDPFSPNGHNLGPCQGRVLYHDGHEYIIHFGRRFDILERKGDVYRPVAALGGIFTGFGNDGTEVVDWDSLLYHPYKGFFPDCFKGHVGDNFVWADTNGDNLVQPEEMQWINT
ncbi:MAG TPA: hypothetical protein VHY09_03255, partial [Candidatus Methylacidiphilales bacterium]|nr:hypothetical protein [Candidatus Methylacidiphilales bacterium]